MKHYSRKFWQSYTDISLLEYGQASKSDGIVTFIASLEIYIAHNWTSYNWYIMTRCVFRNEVKGMYDQKQLPPSFIERGYHLEGMHSVPSTMSYMASFSFNFLDGSICPDIFFMI